MTDKDILSLTKRIEALEKELNKRQKLFDRSYSTVGTSQSDLLLKTRGAIKIQYGNIFIDLIKNGKIVSDNLITSIDSFSDIPTSKTGIYLTEDDNSVYLAINGQIINLKGDIGNTYVSFLGEQTTTGEQKHTALTNIGFLYPTIEEANLSGLQSGIVYIEQENSLYLIVNGQLQKYQVSIPTPLTTQIRINKSDNSRGALIIEGQGENNSLIIGSLLIYQENGTPIFLLEDSNLQLRNQNKESIISYSGNSIIITPSTTFQNGIISKSIKSSNSTDPEFELYVEDGRSYLKVDTLLMQNSSQNLKIIYPKYWMSSNNIITSITENAQSETEDSPETSYNLTLQFQNKYIVGDIIYIYLPFKEQVGDSIIDETTGEVTGYEDPKPYYLLQLLKLQITQVNEVSNSITVNIDFNQEIFSKIDIDTAITLLTNQVTFLINSPLIRFTQTTIDLLTPTSSEQEENSNTVTTQIGQLNLTKTVSYPNSQQETLALNSQGIYSENLITNNSSHYNPSLYSPVFKSGNSNLYPRYEDSLLLPTEDNSQNLATTEWVRRIQQSSLPTGAIIAWSGTEIPEGWVICDGNNNTPNLINKFIKASNTPNQEETISIQSYDGEDKKELLTYTLIFIMKQ